MTVLSRSKNAAVRTGRPVPASGRGASESSDADSGAVTLHSISVRRSALGGRPSEVAVRRHVAESATFQVTAAFHRKRRACAARRCRVYSEHHSAYAGCGSARPPGADTRRPPPPPPLAGVVPFPDKFSNILLTIWSGLLAKSCGVKYLRRPVGRSSTEPPSSTNGPSAVAGRRSTSALWSREHEQWHLGAGRRRGTAHRR